MKWVLISLGEQNNKSVMFQTKHILFSMSKGTFSQKIKKSTVNNNAQTIIESQEMEQNSQKDKKIQI